MSSEGSVDTTLGTAEGNFVGVTYTGRYDNLTIGNSRYENCVFDRVIAKNGTLAGGPNRTVYKDCVFRKCRLKILHGGRATFDDCVFEDTELRTTMFFEGDFVDCRFVGGKLVDVVINGEGGGRHGEPVRVNRVHGNDFSGTLMDGVAFRRGVDLTKQVLPTGPGYIYWPDIGVAVEKVRAVIDELPEGSKVRSNVRSISDLSFSEYEDGQLQDLIYVPGFCRPQELADEVFEFFHRVTVAE